MKVELIIEGLFLIICLMGNSLQETQSEQIVELADADDFQPSEVTEAPSRVEPSKREKSADLPIRERQTRRVRKYRFKFYLKKDSIKRRNNGKCPRAELPKQKKLKNKNSKRRAQK